MVIRMMVVMGMAMVIDILMLLERRCSDAMMSTTMAIRRMLLLLFSVSITPTGFGRCHT